MDLTSPLPSHAKKAKTFFGKLLHHRLQAKDYLMTAPTHTNRSESLLSLYYTSINSRLSIFVNLSKTPKIISLQPVKYETVAKVNSSERNREVITLTEYADIWVKKKAW